jgi:spore protease
VNENEFSFRTDLVMEARDIARYDYEMEIPGVESETQKYDGLTVTRLVISSDDAEQRIGKLKGKYVTLESADLRTRDREKHRQISQVFAREFRDMIRIPTDATVLVVGLGNWNATPDALGPRVVHHLMVTRHLFRLSPPEIHRGLRPVCAIAPGVLGTTGMETAEIIQGIVSKVKPDVVIVVDALASMSTMRVSTTIQIGDTGIQPGSGVGSRRFGITKDSLGVPVLAVGVPTVVDAITIVADAMDIMAQSITEGVQEGDDIPGNKNRRVNAKDLDSPMKRKLIRQVLSPYMGSMIVTPKEIDAMIEDIARVVAGGLNVALHPGVDLEDVETYLQ